MPLTARLMPKELQEAGGPMYLVGVVSTHHECAGDTILFGPLPRGGFTIRADSVVLGGKWSIVAFSREDVLSIIEGLQQVLDDNPEKD